nr:MAG TPA: hypothetical protein [Caudoviricetes sp.]
MVVELMPYLLKDLGTSLRRLSLFYTFLPCSLFPLLKGVLSSISRDKW